MQYPFHKELFANHRFMSSLSSWWQYESKHKIATKDSERTKSDKNNESCVHNSFLEDAKKVFEGKING